MKHLALALVLGVGLIFGVPQVHAEKERIDIDPDILVLLSDQQESDEMLHAIHLFETNQFEELRAVLKDKKGSHKLQWSLLNIHLLGHDKKLDEAIAEANSYSKFMDYFEQGEKQIADGTADRNTKKAIPALADMYYLLNELLGKLYFHKNEYSQALVYFKKTYYPQSPKLAKGFKKDFDDYQMMMICAYTQKNYKEALMFVVDSESVTKAPMEKEARAYNIGALNSLLGNKKEAIRWAKKSLAITVNKQHRLKELKEDHDYDAVRDEKEFQDLLKS